MKAVTLHQPYATLIALGYKQYETRSRHTSHRGLLAIHAGLKVDEDACNNPIISKLLYKHGYNAKNLPTGCIVAVAQVTDSFEVVDHQLQHVTIRNKRGQKRMIFDVYERAAGDFDIGRKAWMLEDVKKLDKPITAKGQQGLWDAKIEICDYCGYPSDKFQTSLFDAIKNKKRCYECDPSK